MRLVLLLAVLRQAERGGLSGSRLQHLISAMSGLSAQPTAVKRHFWRVGALNFSDAQLKRSARVR
jgi:hypothetical protein